MASSLTEPTEGVRTTMPAPSSSSSFAFVESPELLRLTDRLPSVRGRASQVSSLIRSYGLLDSSSSSTVISPTELSPSDLEAAFHSPAYVDFLRRIGERGADAEKLAEEEGAEYGIGYDCPPFDDLLETCLALAGASAAAAEALTSGKHRVAINWCGGWHHAQRDAAEGFCYVNDIVVAVRALGTKFDAVLYVDLDVHHGNGVENAFAFSPKVFTLSLHLKEPGFYPGTGGLDDRGMGKGRDFCLNVPLREGITDDKYVPLFKQCLSSVSSFFRPSAAVVQCGSDSLAGDPLGGFCLTPDAVVQCVQEVLKLNLPTLLLGGGGYVSNAAAALWTRVTAAVAGVRLDPEIPDRDPFFPRYGPSFDLDDQVPRGRRPDLNDGGDLAEVARRVEERFRRRPRPPSSTSSPPS